MIRPEQPLVNGGRGKPIDGSGGTVEGESASKPKNSQPSTSISGNGRTALNNTEAVHGNPPPNDPEAGPSSTLQNDRGVGPANPPQNDPEEGPVNNPQNCPGEEPANNSQVSPGVGPADNPQNVLDSTFLPVENVDPIYYAKARILNHALRRIGMGRYQWQLLVIASFGWLSNELWPTVTSHILTPMSKEFGPLHPHILILSQNLGLLLGAAAWGFSSDIVGRRWAFNYTLGLTAIFSLATAGSPNFATACTLAAMYSFCVGGNLVVDSAVVLEALPGSHEHLLIILSANGSVAQMITNLVSWPLLTRLSCGKHQETCSKGDNLGWRYLLIAMGLLTFVMFLVRALNKMYESPKYLMSQGLDEGSVIIIHRIAGHNKTTSPLSPNHLRACEPEGFEGQANEVRTLRKNLEMLHPKKICLLFSTRQLAQSTGCIMLIWGLVGLAHSMYDVFMPYAQTQKGVHFGDMSTNKTYKESLIIASLGVPGALLATVLTHWGRVGRKVLLAVSGLLTGTVVIFSPLANFRAGFVAFSCLFNFCRTMMHAVLYCYTAELFATPQRGTGNALAAVCGRMFGVIAPILTMFANLETYVPLYVSGTLFVCAGLLPLFIPYGTKGCSAL